MYYRAVSVLGVFLPIATAVDWCGWGGNVLNNRYAANNTQIKASSISSLSQQCRLVYPLGTSATPVTAGNIVYYPTYNGSFVALDYTTCLIQWQINVTDIVVKFAPLTAAQKAFAIPASRTSPQIDGDVLYFGTQAHALLIAISRTTGAVLDKIQINSHEMAVITMSPTVYNGNIFIGSSSLEEAAAGLIPNYPCCSFIGNILSLRFDKDHKNFSVHWKVPMLPANGGWSGVGVWGSQPSIDAARNQVYFATGNVYRFPPQYEHCENETSSCLPASVLQEAVIAFDMASGSINWIKKITPLDGWTVACGGILGAGRNTTLCPNTPGPDADFGMAPTFVPKTQSSLSHDVVVIGQKNGILYSLSADNGTILWATRTSPGATSAGLSWGVAVDNTRVYFTGINSGEVTWQMQPSNETISNSAYGAARLSDGALLWETQAPKNAISFGPPTVVGDIVLVARTGRSADPNLENRTGGLVVMNKATGKVIKDLTLDTNFHSGIAVQADYVIFGTGYSQSYSGTGSLYVMKLT